VNFFSSVVLGPQGLDLVATLLPALRSHLLCELFQQRSLKFPLLTPQLLNPLLTKLDGEWRSIFDVSPIRIISLRQQPMREGEIRDGRGDDDNTTSALGQALFSSSENFGSVFQGLLAVVNVDYLQN
jgi:hypothetical protein